MCSHSYVTHVSTVKDTLINRLNSSIILVIRNCCYCITHLFATCCCKKNIIYVYTYPYIRYNYLSRVERTIMNLMIPIHYFTKTTILNNNEILMMQQCWKHIMHDTCPNYLHKKKYDIMFKYTSCITYFYDLFYDRMFIINTHCKTLFEAGLKLKIQIIINVISTILHIFDDMAEFNTRIQCIANTHNKLGVDIIDYILFSDNICWTFEQVLGAELFNEQMYQILLQMFHKIYEVLLPLVILDKQISVGHENIHKKSNKYAKKTFVKSYINLCRPNTTFRPVSSIM